jgi:hypothetical protein
VREFVLAMIEDALDGDPEALRWIADRLEGYDAFTVGNPSEAAEAGPSHTH